jgi:ribonuclease BN (tRNA processing enzyme)
MNHPVVNFGYRIEANGKSVFVTGDHEPPINIYNPGDPDYEEYQSFVDEKTASILRAMMGVDVLIADCSYTTSEYVTKRGWGHGTYHSSIGYAKEARAKVLYCTHHEPNRSDDALESVFSDVLHDHPRQVGDPHYRLAREGESFEF